MLISDLREDEKRLGFARYPIPHPGIELSLGAVDPLDARVERQKAIGPAPGSPTATAVAARITSRIWVFKIGLAGGEIGYSVQLYDPERDPRGWRFSPIGAFHRDPIEALEHARRLASGYLAPAGLELFTQSLAQNPGLGFLEGWYVRPGDGATLRQVETSASTQDAPAHHRVQVVADVEVEEGIPKAVWGVLNHRARPAEPWQRSGLSHARDWFRRYSPTEAYGTFVSRGPALWRIERLEIRVGGGGADLPVESVLLWMHHRPIERISEVPSS